MIFVTGGTGLVGSHLLFQLTKQGKRVRALKRKTSNITLVEKLFNAYSDNGSAQMELIEWVDGDVEDFHSVADALIGVDEVYHCAALVSFSKSDATRMLDANVQGTANMVDASIDAKVKKFCHVSSIASLGAPNENNIVDEDSPWGKSKEKSGYAISKFRSEMEAWRGSELGLNVVIVNPSVIIGPCSWTSGSGLYFGTISKGFPFYTLGVTGYVDVRDVVNSMVTLMDKEVFAKRFVINSENISHKEVFSNIAKAMGKREPSIRVTPLITSLVWPLAWFGSLFTGKTPAITRDTSKSAHNKTYYSSERIKKEIGIEFIPISDAIRNTVRVGSL
jgi:nucleoside-diphosphate-sugar epimerase